MMQSITFTCEVITPMFLAGADGTTPELRPASIKGALRFWWRAMNGHLPLKDEKDENGNVISKGLKTIEAEIFGGSGEGQGRSNVVIRVKQPFPNVSNNTILPYHKVESYNKKYKVNILDYLAFGISQYDKNATHPGKNVLQREYIAVGEKFYLQFNFDEKYQTDLAKTLYLLSEFGGLGAKSRNGFGCFKILTNTDFLEKVEISDFSKTASSYSTISKISKIYDTNDFSNWNLALAELGDIYQNARENVEIHHDYDKRGMLAAPIIVRENNKSVQKTFLDRHAKPYFLHVSKGDNGKYFGTILSMPSNFLEHHPDFSQEHSANYKTAIADFDKLIFKK
jgi:CRISPR-associated protein Cmr1